MQVQLGVVEKPVVVLGEGVLLPPEVDLVQGGPVDIGVVQRLGVQVVRGRGGEGVVVLDLVLGEGQLCYWYVGMAD